MPPHHKSYYILYGAILLYCYFPQNLRIFFPSSDNIIYLLYTLLPNMYLPTWYKNYIIITCPEEKKNSPESHIIIIIIIIIIIVIDPITYENLFRISCHCPSHYAMVAAIYNIITCTLFIYVPIFTLSNTIKRNAGQSYYSLRPYINVGVFIQTPLH